MIRIATTSPYKEIIIEYFELHLEEYPLDQLLEL
jgi:hypothetical protein